MKILLVCHSFLPCFEAGGVVKSVYEMANELCLLGHEPTIYTTDGCTKRLNVVTNIETNYKGIPVIYFKNLSNKLRIKYKIALPYRLIQKTIQNIHKFDVIHLNEYNTTLNIIIYLASIIYNKPIIFQAHGSMMFKSNSIIKKMLKHLFDISFGKRLLNRSKYIIALNEHEKKHYDQYSIDRNKIVILPNSISVNRENIIKKTDKQLYKVIFIGRLHQDKGLNTLLQAAQYLSHSIYKNKMIFYIVGPDDGCLSTIKDHINKHKMKNFVILLGPQYGRHKDIILNNSDIITIPSINETFPMILLESLERSKPIIASNISPIQSIIQNNKEGLLFNMGDGIDLAHKIIYMVNNYEEATLLGRNGRIKLIKKWDSKYVITKLEKIYMNSIK
jgi:glycosyltransferase involved in cell wall biosynthesis